MLANPPGERNVIAEGVITVTAASQTLDQLIVAAVAYPDLLLWRRNAEVVLLTNYGSNAGPFYAGYNLNPSAAAGAEVGEEVHPGSGAYPVVGGLTIAKLKLIAGANLRVGITILR